MLGDQGLWGNEPLVSLCRQPVGQLCWESITPEGPKAVHWHHVTTPKHEAREHHARIQLIDRKS